MRCFWTTAPLILMAIAALMLQPAAAQQYEREPSRTSGRQSHSRQTDNADAYADDYDDASGDDRGEDGDRSKQNDDSNRDRYSSQFGNDRTRSSRDYGQDRNPEFATDLNSGERGSRSASPQPSFSRSSRSAGRDQDSTRQATHEYSNGMWRRATNSRHGSAGEHDERFASRADEFIRQYDDDRDSYLSHRELPRGMLENFHDLDRNGDGYLSWRELQQHGATLASGKPRERQAAAEDEQSAARTAPVEVAFVWVMDSESGHARLADLQGAYDILQRLDADSDGQITRSELRDRRQHVVSRWIERGFDRVDADGDGVISRDEANRTMLQERFDRLDLNDDEQLTRGELLRTSENASRWWGPQDEDAYLSEEQDEERRR